MSTRRGRFFDDLPEGTDGRAGCVQQRREAVAEASNVVEPKPCAKCPYRKDAPLELWMREEFERVLREDRKPLGLGNVFGCHKHGNRHRAGEKTPMCAGGVLDQLKRDMPSVMLRFHIAKSDNPQATYDALNSVSSEGMELYATIEEMCAANGVSE
jgi:hypothetical protein